MSIVDNVKIRQFRGEDGWGSKDPDQVITDREVGVDLSQLGGEPYRILPGNILTKPSHIVHKNVSEFFYGTSSPSVQKLNNTRTLPPLTSSEVIKEKLDSLPATKLLKCCEQDAKMLRQMNAKMLRQMDAKMLERIDAKAQHLYDIATSALENISSAMIIEDQAVIGSKWFWDVEVSGYDVEVIPCPEYKFKALKGRVYVRQTGDNATGRIYLARLEDLSPLSCPDCGGSGTIECRLIGFDHSWQETCSCQEGK